MPASPTRDRLGIVGAHRGSEGRGTRLDRPCPASQPVALGRGKVVAALPPYGHEPTGVRIAHQRCLACARGRRVALGLDCADLAIHLRRLRDVRTRVRAGDGHGRRGREAAGRCRPSRSANCARYSRAQLAFSHAMLGVLIVEAGAGCPKLGLVSVSWNAMGVLQHPG